MSGTAFSDELRAKMEMAGAKDPSYFERPNPCAMCGLQLRTGERKVHAGVCSRARELALQRRRRQARRLPQ